MAAALGSLVVSLGLDAADYVQGLNKSQYQAKRFVDEFGRNLSAATAAIGALGAATGAVIATLTHAVDAVSVYQNLAEQIGDTASSVLGLQTAADVSGVALDTVAAASAKLTNQLAKNDDEAKGAAAAVAALGISVQDFKNLSPTAQLQKLADQMAKFADGTEKTAVAMALFGRSGAQIVPFLNDLADVGSKNAKLTDEQIKAADIYMETLAAFQSEVKQTAQVLVVELVPGLQAVVESLQSSGDAISILKNGAEVLRIIFETLVVLTANVVFVFKAVGAEIAGIAAQIGALLRLDLTGFNAISKAMKEDAARARAELDAFERRILNPVVLDAATAAQNRRELARTAGAKPRINVSGLAVGGSSDKDKLSEAQRFLESLQKQLDTTQSLTIEEKTLKEIQSGRLAGLTPQIKEQALAVSRQIDAQKQLTDQLKFEEEQEKRFYQERQRIADEGKRLFDETRTPAEKLNIELTKLDKLLDDGVISWDVYSRAVLDAQDEFDKTAQGAKKVSTEMDEFAKNAARNIQESLGDGLFDIMKGNFDNIGQAFSDMILRMIAEAQAAKIARYLFGDLVQGGEGSGVAGDLFTSILGGLFGGGKSGGGSAMPGTMYRVAENRPEMLDVNGQQYLMMGNQRGRIDPNPRWGGQAVQVHNSFTIQGTPNRQSEQQIAASVGVAVSRASRRLR